MSKFFLDTRELRSFRLKYHTSELNSILKSKTSTVGICVTNSFYPKDRQLWRENSLDKEVNITAIPNQVGRFLFNDKEKLWHNVRNLFKGQIFLVKSNTNKNLSISTLKQFLSLKKFYLRILFSKDQLYREDAIITKSFVNLTEKTASINLIVFLKYQLTRVIFLNTVTTVVKSLK